MKARFLGLVPVVLLAFGSALAQPEATPAVEVVDLEAVVDLVDPVGPAGEVDLEEACDELLYTPADPVEELAASGRCKPCKDRPECKCTYNGLPRVSCTPCCWGNLGIPQICLD